MELLEDILALAEWPLHAVKQLLQDSWRASMMLIPANASDYQKEQLSIQIETMQQTRLRQFRALKFLQTLSFDDTIRNSVLPVFIDLTSGFKFVLFQISKFGTLSYSPEWIIFQVKGDFLLHNRFKHRFVLPFQMYYKDTTETIDALMDFDEYSSLLPFEFLMKAFFKTRFKHYERVFLYALQQLCEVLSLLHANNLTLNGDFSPLCVNRRTSFVRINTCMFAAGIPTTLEEGVLNDLRSLLKFAQFYSSDVTLFLTQEIFDGVGSLCCSLAALETRSHMSIDSDSWKHTFIPDPFQAAKCLAQASMFFSNRYPVLSFNCTSITDIINKADGMTTPDPYAAANEEPVSNPVYSFSIASRSHLFDTTILEIRLEEGPSQSFSCCGTQASSSSILPRIPYRRAHRIVEAAYENVLGGSLGTSRALLGMIVPSFLGASKQTKNDTSPAALEASLGNDSPDKSSDEPCAVKTPQSRFKVDKQHFASCRTPLTLVCNDCLDKTIYRAIECGAARSHSALPSRRLNTSTTCTLDVLALDLPFRKSCSMRGNKSSLHMNTTKLLSEIEGSQSPLSPPPPSLPSDNAQLYLLRTEASAENSDFIGPAKRSVSFVTDHNHFSSLTPHNRLYLGNESRSRSTMGICYKSLGSSNFFLGPSAILKDSICDSDDYCPCMLRGFPKTRPLSVPTNRRTHLCMENRLNIRTNRSNRNTLIDNVICTPALNVTDWKVDGQNYRSVDSDTAVVSPDPVQSNSVIRISSQNDTNIESSLIGTLERERSIESGRSNIALFLSQRRATSVRCFRHKDISLPSPEETCIIKERNSRSYSVNSAGSCSRQNEVISNISSTGRMHHPAVMQLHGDEPTISKQGGQIVMSSIMHSEFIKVPEPCLAKEKAWGSRLATTRGAGYRRRVYNIRAKEPPCSQQFIDSESDNTLYSRVELTLPELARQRRRSVTQYDIEEHFQDEGIVERVSNPIQDLNNFIKSIYSSSR